MNNDRSPAWKMEKVVTINSEFSLCGLIKVEHFGEIEEQMKY